MYMAYREGHAHGDGINFPISFNVKFTKQDITVSEIEKKINNYPINNLPLTVIKLAKYE